MNNIFPQRLIELRKEKSLSQEALGKALGMKRSTISGYEVEGKQPDFDTLMLFAKYFGVSTDYLLGYSKCKTHSEEVFINDTQNFKKHYDSLPPELRQTIAQIYDRFYVLLSRDMIKNNSERLGLYQELFSVLQDSRAQIRNKVDFCDGQVSDPLLLSELMSLQSSLKNNVASILDRLMQADINTAFGVKKADTELIEKTAT